MNINSRSKGQRGEREIAKILNEIVNKVRHDNNLKELEPKDFIFQRNQNQSAIGGDDLTNTINLSIEVKRQEKLSINSWWKQCTESSSRTKSTPILIYRQNNKPWRIIMEGFIPIYFKCIETVIGYEKQKVITDVSLEDFKLWFYKYYKNYLYYVNTLR